MKKLTLWQFTLVIQNNTHNIMVGTNEENKGIRFHEENKVKGHSAYVTP